jgi:hypothetical protein
MQGLSMNQSQPQATATGRLRTYQVLFLISILGNLVVGFWALFDPVGFTRLLHQPEPFPEAWPRIWAATLLGLHILYIPGLLNPLLHRLPNWTSIGIKLFMPILYVSAGHYFFPFAAWDFSFGMILLIAYYRLVGADLRLEP